MGTKALDRPKGYPGLVVVLRNLENALETGSLRQSDSPLPTPNAWDGWEVSDFSGVLFAPVFRATRSQAPVPTVDPKSVVRA